MTPRLFAAATPSHPGTPFALLGNGTIVTGLSSTELIRAICGAFPVESERNLPKGCA